MTARRCRFALGLPLLLAACAGGPVGSAPSADPVAATDCRRLVEEAGPGPPALTVVTLGPLEVAGAAESGGDAARCRLLVGGLEIREVRREPGGILTLEGERTTGTRRRPNPEHRRLVRELRRLERKAERGTRLSRTGDPAVDIVGTLLSGVLDLLRRGERERTRAELEARLARTPRSVEEPVLVRERFAAEITRLERRGRVVVVLWDAATGRAWRARVPFRERRILARPLDGRNDRRPPPGITLVATGDDTNGQDPPPRLSLGELLAGLRPALATPGELVGLADIETALRAAAVLPAAGRPRGPEADAGTGGIPVEALPVRVHPAVVQVGEGEGTRALGFYVASDRVLTLTRALPAGSLVPVETGDGRRLYGLVDARDEALGLALLWVPRPGPPLAWARGEGTGSPALLLPRADVAVRAGAPVVVGEGVLAMVGAVRPDRSPLIHAGDLRRFTARVLAASR